MDVEKRAILEAALFISHEPLSMEELCKILDTDSHEVQEILDDIRFEFDSRKHGIELFHSGGHYELRVKPKYLKLVSHLTPYADLSRGMLKVLALVAFKQPITQSEIVRIIGNRAYSYIQDLEEKRLITSTKFKKTKLLETTQEFMDYFGLEDRADIVNKFKDALKEKQP